VVAGGDDDGGHAVAHEDADGHADLEQGEPHGLLGPSELVDPDGVVHQQKDLAHSRYEPSAIGCVLLGEENEAQEGELEHHQGHYCQDFGVEVLVESACEHAHD